MSFDSPSIKHATDKETGEVTDKYPPTLKTKVPCWDDKFSCHVYDHEKKEITGDISEHVNKGQTVMAIIKCGGVWFSGGKYGCSWKIDQLKIVSKPQGLVGYAFRDDEEEEED